MAVVREGTRVVVVGQAADAEVTVLAAAVDASVRKRNGEPG